jgi:hypothetical protein
MLKTVPEADAPVSVPAMWTGILVPAAPSVQLGEIWKVVVVEAVSVTAPAANAVAAVAIVYIAVVLVTPFVAVSKFHWLRVAAVACPTTKSQSKCQLAEISGSVNVNGVAAVEPMMVAATHDETVPPVPQDQSAARVKVFPLLRYPAVLPELPEPMPTYPAATRDTLLSIEPLSIPAVLFIE